MSQSNTNIGLSLTTVAAGTSAPIQTNTLGFISPTCFYTQITVATNTNNSLALPINPIVGQIYTIRNESVVVVFIFPGSTTSTINYGGVTNQYGSVPIAPYSVISFIAISNNNALNTAATTLSPNNPLINWHTFSALPSAITDIAVPTTTTTMSLAATAGSNIELNSLNQYIIPAMAGAIAVTLPANAVCDGEIFLFKMSATTGFAITFTAATATTIKGVYIQSGGSTIKTAATTAVISATSVAGDTFSIQCDGTYWYVNGVSSAAAAFS